MDLSSCDRACSAEVLGGWVRDARARTIALVADLDDEQLLGPKLSTVNPLLWEIGHATWFQEHWVLQHAGGHKSIWPDGEKLWNSISIPHDVRWELPLPSREDALRYLCEVRDRTVELIDRGQLSDEVVYFVKLSVFHEDMHTEAFTYTRQTLGYPPPRFSMPLAGRAGKAKDAVRGDAHFEGGTLPLGARPDDPFVFDNEQWAHEICVKPFAISRTAVSQGEFAEFVEDGGYVRPELWSGEGWRWREAMRASHPVYWKREGDGWLHRHFDQWLPLEFERAVIHVNWFEAEAFCRWTGRRLPTEAEWELAARGTHEARHYAWGNDPPTPQHANLDWSGMGTVDVADYPLGQNPSGCCQMIGNVWEWTATTFYPYPGFKAGPYEEYSRTCFGETKVLRGGCWATRSRLIRNTLRNFYRPHRNDVLAGFRTCVAPRIAGEV